MAPQSIFIVDVIEVDVHAMNKTHVDVYGVQSVVYLCKYGTVTRTVYTVALIQ